MRRVQHPQIKLGEAAVSKIKLDTRSRDEIPKLLMGLQHIYCTSEITDKKISIEDDFKHTSVLVRIF